TASSSRACPCRSTLSAGHETALAPSTSGGAGVAGGAVGNGRAMRLPEGPQRMRAAVVGAGAWGTAFACVLAARGHDGTLAARDPEQARAIEETGRNPRHLPNVDLEGISATTVGDPSLAGTDLHVVAVPSAAFGEVVRALPGAAPVLSLTKGLDPERGGRRAGA